jgi:hypothetical protein
MAQGRTQPGIAIIVSIETQYWEMKRAGAISIHGYSDLRHPLFQKISVKQKTDIAPFERYQ